MAGRVRGCEAAERSLLRDKGVERGRESLSEAGLHHEEENMRYVVTLLIIARPIVLRLLCQLLYCKDNKTFFLLCSHSLN